MSKEFLTEMSIMAHADYFVGSSTSGIPTIIATLRMHLYKKSAISFADVSYSSLGCRIRPHWGIGGFQNVTLDLSE